MLLLTSTSDKIRLTTSGTADIDVHTSYLDYDGTDVTTGRDNTKITSATTTDIVAAPASATTRNVKTIHIANVHASTANTVTLIHTDGTDAIALESVSLAAGERLGYVEGVGLRVYDANGIEKAPPLAVGSYIVTRLASTVTIASTTAAKVTGLDTAVSAAGTYVFEYFLRFQSATGTVGWKLSSSFSGTASVYDYTLMFPTGTTTDSTGVADQVVTAPGVMATQAGRAEDTTGAMIMTAGVDTTAADILVQLTGLMVCSTTGNIELYHGSETATNTSIMVDSLLRVTRFA